MVSFKLQGLLIIAGLHGAAGVEVEKPEAIKALERYAALNPNDEDLWGAVVDINEKKCDKEFGTIPAGDPCFAAKVRARFARELKDFYSETEPDLNLRLAALRTETIRELVNLDPNLKQDFPDHDKSTENNDEEQKKFLKTIVELSKNNSQEIKDLINTTLRKMRTLNQTCLLQGALKLQALIIEYCCILPHVDYKNKDDQFIVDYVKAFQIKKEHVVGCAELIEADECLQLIIRLAPMLYDNSILAILGKVLSVVEEYHSIPDYYIDRRLFALNMKLAEYVFKCGAIINDQNKNQLIVKIITSKIFAINKKFALTVQQINSIRQRRNLHSLRNYLALAHMLVKNIFNWFFELAMVFRFLI